MRVVLRRCAATPARSRGGALRVLLLRRLRELQVLQQSLCRGVSPENTQRDWAAAGRGPAGWTQARVVELHGTSYENLQGQLRPSSRACWSVSAPGWRSKQRLFPRIKELGCLSQQPFRLRVQGRHVVILLAP